MSEEQRRLDQLEVESIRCQLRTLSADVEKLQPSRGFLAVVKALTPLIMPIVVAGIGWYATKSITGAIEREKLELSQVTAIQEMLVALSKPGIEPGEATATAVTLAAFGPPAIPPLIHVLGASGHVGQDAAGEGLRTLAFQHSSAVCDALTDVLDQRPRLFTWETHLLVVELLGEIGCVDALPVLQRYQDMLGAPNALSRYTSMVSEPAPERKDIEDVQDKLGKAIERLVQ